jgi:hypothetical protein
MNDLEVALRSRLQSSASLQNFEMSFLSLSGKSEVFTAEVAN